MANGTSAASKVNLETNALPLDPPDCRAACPTPPPSTMHQWLGNDQCSTEDVDLPFHGKEYFSFFDQKSVVKSLRNSLLLAQQNSLVDDYGQLVCELCGFKAFSLEIFKYHLVSSHLSAQTNGNLLIVCAHCEQEFNSDTAYRVHLKHHASKMYIKCCPHCPQKLPFQELVKHSSSHLPNLFDVSVQNKKIYSNLLWISKNSAVDIMKYAFSSNDCMYLCPVCGYVTNYVKNLHRHVIVMHLSARSATEGFIKCPHCIHSSSDEGEHRNHVKSHRKQSCFPCVFCSKTSLKKTDREVHIKLHLPVPNRAKINLNKNKPCSKSFPDISSTYFKPTNMDRAYFPGNTIRKKIRMELNRCASDIAMFKCPFCSYTNKSKNVRNTRRHLFSHLTSVQSNSGNIECPHCRAVFQEEHLFRTHLTEAHYMVGQLCCPFCTYKTHGDLYNHFMHCHSHSLQPEIFFEQPVSKISKTDLPHSANDWLNDERRKKSHTVAKNYLDVQEQNQSPVECKPLCESMKNKRCLGKVCKSMVHSTKSMEVCTFGRKIEYQSIEDTALCTPERKLEEPSLQPNEFDHVCITRKDREKLAGQATINCVTSDAYCDALAVPSIFVDNQGTANSTATDLACGVATNPKTCGESHPIIFSSVKFKDPNCGVGNPNINHSPVRKLSKIHVNNFKRNTPPKQESICSAMPPSRSASVKFTGNQCIAKDKNENSETINKANCFTITETDCINSIQPINQSEKSLHHTQRICQVTESDASEPDSLANVLLISKDSEECLSNNELELDEKRAAMKAKYSHRPCKSAKAIDLKIKNSKCKLKYFEADTIRKELRKQLSCAGGAPILNCPFCSYVNDAKKMDLRNTRRHVLSHLASVRSNTGKILCPYCKATFENEYFFRTHLKKGHKKPGQTCCPFCTYKAKKDIHSHLMKCHSYVLQPEIFLGQPVCTMRAILPLSADQQFTDQTKVIVSHETAASQPSSQSNEKFYEQSEGQFCSKSADTQRNSQKDKEVSDKSDCTQLNSYEIEKNPIERANKHMNFLKMKLPSRCEKLSINTPQNDCSIEHHTSLSEPTKINEFGSIGRTDAPLISEEDCEESTVEPNEDVFFTVKEEFVESTVQHNELDTSHVVKNEPIESTVQHNGSNHIFMSKIKNDSSTQVFSSNEKKFAGEICQCSKSCAFEHHGFCSCRKIVENKLSEETAVCMQLYVNGINVIKKSSAAERSFHQRDNHIEPCGEECCTAATNSSTCKCQAAANGCVTNDHHPYGESEAAANGCAINDHHCFGESDDHHSCGKSEAAENGFASNDYNLYGENEAAANGCATNDHQFSGESEAAAHGCAINDHHYYGESDDHHSCDDSVTRVEMLMPEIPLNKDLLYNKLGCFNNTTNDQSDSNNETLEKMVVARTNEINRTGEHSLYTRAVNMQSHNLVMVNKEGDMMKTSTPTRHSSDEHCFLAQKDSITENPSSPKYIDIPLVQCPINVNLSKEADLNFVLREVIICSMVTQLSKVGQTTVSAILECQFCHRSYLSKHEFIHHLVVSHLSFLSDNDGNISCPYCETMFHADHLFHKHLRKKHCVLNKLICSQCPFTAPNFHEWCNHFIGAHFKEVHSLYIMKGIYEYSKTRFVDAENMQIKFKHDVMTSIGPLKKCPFCSYVSQSKRPDSHKLKIHMIGHLATEPSNDGELKCPHCKASFLTENSFRHHIKKVHRSEGKHWCRFCSFKSPVLGQVTSHVLVVHAYSLVPEFMHYKHNTTNGVSNGVNEIMKDAITPRKKRVITDRYSQIVDKANDVESRMIQECIFPTSMSRSMSDERRVKSVAKHHARSMMTGSNKRKRFHASFNQLKKYKSSDTKCRPSELVRTCPHCSWSGVSRKELRDHLKCSHMDASEKYFCSMCPFTIEDAMIFEEHLFLHSANKFSSLNDACLGTIPILSDQDDGSWSDDERVTKRTKRTKTKSNSCQAKPRILEQLSENTDIPHNNRSEDNVDHVIASTVFFQNTCKKIDSAVTNSNSTFLNNVNTDVLRNTNDLVQTIEHLPLHLDNNKANGEFANKLRSDGPIIPAPSEENFDYDDMSCPKCSFITSDVKLYEIHLLKNHKLKK